MSFLSAAIGFDPPPASGGNAGAGVSGGGVLPSGKLAEWVTASIIVGTIFAAIASNLHLFGMAPAPLVDLFATIAFGVATARGAASSSALTAAQTAALNTVNSNTAALVSRAELNTSLAQAAHERLDALKAPAAQVDHTGMTVGDARHGTTRS